MFVKLLEILLIRILAKLHDICKLTSSDFVELILFDDLREAFIRCDHTNEESLIHLLHLGDKHACRASGAL